ncbi:hypothetical protein C1H46_028250 [Malus baccata]|uniref:Uncharacterized protein n=1 Tax=Malus baccata TaxID=106549 RepID=A0A540LI96_MALBA|nr:hypothetical protein C1H46_028250 [Malus baccata]
MNILLPRNVLGGWLQNPSDSKIKKVKMVVFDKTGTLRVGELVVVDDVHLLQLLNGGVLCCAIATEDFEVHTGAGVSGRVGDKMVLVGNKRLMRENNVQVGPEFDKYVSENENLARTCGLVLSLQAHVNEDGILAADCSLPSCNWVGVTYGVRHLLVMPLNLTYIGPTAVIILPHRAKLSPGAPIKLT